MRKLLEKAKNIINQVRSTDTITADVILSKAKKIADDLVMANPDQRPPTPPTIILRTDAHDEANCLNMINQAIMGTKEGVAKAIKTIAGSTILDAVLCIADGADIKGIGEYQLHKVITAILDGADHSTTMDIHIDLIISESCGTHLYIHESRESG